MTSSKFEPVGDTGGGARDAGGTTTTRSGEDSDDNDNDNRDNDSDENDRSWRID